MNSLQRFQYLLSKYELIKDNLRPDTALTIEMTLSHIKRGTEEQIAKIPGEVLEDYDETLERFIAQEMLDEDVAAVRAKLVAQYGFASFADEPGNVLKQIERKGKASTDREWRILQQFLAGDFLGNLESKQRIDKLKVIAKAYQARK